jgi:hypothetical protein
VGGGNSGRYQAVAAEKMVQGRVADRNDGGCWEVMVVTSDGGLWVTKEKEDNVGYWQ